MTINGEREMEQSLHKNASYKQKHSCSSHSTHLTLLLWSWAALLLTGLVSLTCLLTRLVSVQVKHKISSVVTTWGKLLGWMRSGGLLERPLCSPMATGFWKWLAAPCLPPAPLAQSRTTLRKRSCQVLPMPALLQPPARLLQWTLFVSHQVAAVETSSVFPTQPWLLWICWGGPLIHNSGHDTCLLGII